jgi:hypothetical protein
VPAALGADPAPTALLRLRVLLTKAHALVSEAAEVAEDAMLPPAPPRPPKGRRGASGGGRGVTWGGWA